MVLSQAGHSGLCLKLEEWVVYDTDVDAAGKKLRFIA